MHADSDNNAQRLAHISVMPTQVLHFLAIRDGKRYIDATVGAGGHAATILAAADCQLLGIDRDREALRLAGTRLAAYGTRATLQHGRFSAMAELVARQHWDKVDGVLLDVGVSSMQIDTGVRGFSYRQDAPLDMRMDQASATTAAELLNHLSVDDLTQLIRNYGDEPQARRIATAIVTRRRQKAWERTGELAELLEGFGKFQQGRRSLVTVMRVFQALRIAVNDELSELQAALQAALQLLRPGGRIVVISFHSLEDREVKHYFRNQAASCICPPGLPRCCCQWQATLQVLTRRPLRPDAAEIELNSRAAPARLRAAERLGN